MPHPAALRIWSWSKHLQIYHWNTAGQLLPAQKIEVHQVTPWPKNACLLPPSSTHYGFWIKYLTNQIKSDHFLEDPFIIYISFTTVQLRFHPDLEDLNPVRPHLWPPRPASGVVHRYGMLIQKLYSSVYIKINNYELLRNMYVCNHLNI